MTFADGVTILGDFIRTKSIVCNGCHVLISTDIAIRFLFNSWRSASWADVTRAFWVKYPNPYSTHVLSVDVISRYFVDYCSWVILELIFLAMVCMAYMWWLVVGLIGVGFTCVGVYVGNG